MQPLKIEAAILLTLVNAPHPRQLDLHIFNVLFFLLSPSLLCVSPFSLSLCLSVLCETVWSLIGILRRACSACWEGAFCIRNARKKQAEKISTIVVIRDFGKARHPHRHLPHLSLSLSLSLPLTFSFSLSLSQVFQATVMVSIWSARGERKVLNPWAV